MPYEEGGQTRSAAKALCYLRLNYAEKNAIVKLQIGVLLKRSTLAFIWEQTTWQCKYIPALHKHL